MGKRTQPRQPHHDPRDDSAFQRGGFRSSFGSSPLGADDDGRFDHRVAEEGGSRAGTRYKVLGRDGVKRWWDKEMSNDPAHHQEKERRSNRLIRSRRHEELIKSVDADSMALFKARQAHVPPPPPPPPRNPIVRLWRWFTR